MNDIKQPDDSSIEFSKVYAWIRDNNLTALADYMQEGEEQHLLTLNAIAQIGNKKQLKHLFTPEDVHNYTDTQWVYFFIRIIQAFDANTFYRYFNAERYVKLSQESKDSLLRRALHHKCKALLLTALADLGAQVDITTLNTTSPQDKNFNWIIQNCPANTLNSYIKERLYHILMSVKHPINYTPVAKAALAQHNGIWNKALPEKLLSFYSDIKPYLTDNIYFYTTDWLVYAQLTNDFMLFDRVLLGLDDLNSKASNGMTPLVEAAGRQSGTPYLLALFAKGADVNYCDGNNFSPLFATFMSDTLRSQNIEFLLSKGANTNHRDSEHKTLLARFNQNFDAQTIELMIAHGAKYIHDSEAEFEEAFLKKLKD